MKIFVVEDDNVSRLLLRRILEKEPSWEIIEAINGRAAWDLLQQGLMPDVCLLDVLLPEMSGIELLRRIREDSRLKHLKVILCSAVNDGATLTQAAALSIAGHILKPFTGAKVFEEVYKAVLAPQQHSFEKQTFRMCSFLGITREEYLDLLGILSHEVTQGLRRVREAILKNEIRAAIIQLNAIRCACSNLGAASLIAAADKLGVALETLRHTPSSECPGDHQTTGPLTLGAITALLEIEEENRRLISQMAPDPSPAPGTPLPQPIPPR
jgi:two-component system, chemotaxis family, chemotaxis protein CheY